MQYTLDKEFSLDIIKQLNKLSDELIRETEIEGFKVYTGSQRYRVYEKDNFECKQCGSKGLHAKLIVTKFEDSKSERGHFVVIMEDGKLLTKDHIYPKSRGGKNKIENLQCLCNVCNEAKGNDAEDMDKNRAIIKCKCSLKSLIGFEVSKELSETLLNNPVTQNGGTEVIGIVTAVDYENDKVEINLFGYILPEVTIDNDKKIEKFESIELLSHTYEVEPSFRDMV